MSTHVKSSKNNKISWWCPQCKRHGHSWERCSFNPESINYRPNVLLQNSSSTASYSSTPLISSA
ncbi:unnamed protein product, partial [Rotaria socialis]